MAIQSTEPLALLEKTMVADILDNLREKISQVPDKLKEMPDKLKEVPEKLEDVPEKLQARGQEVGRKLKEALEDLRDEGEERAWEIEQRALRLLHGAAEAQPHHGRQAQHGHKGRRDMIRVPGDGVDAQGQGAGESRLEGQKAGVGQP